MVSIDIKPLSVNEAWQGRRFKSDVYKNYERNVLIMLPKMIIPAGKLRIELTFSISNAAGDIDNPVKPFLDILQKKYGFNDSRIYELSVKKIVVPRNQESINFSIKSI